MNKQYLKKIFLFGTAAAIACLPSIVAAAEQFNLNVPIGDLTGFNVDNDSFGKYIQAWYGFLLGTIGIIATSMIMWGGFKYLTSRGDKGTIDGAKTTIISAITGVVLAFGTYTLLALVNPALLKISMPELPGIAGGGDVNLSDRGIGSQEPGAGGGSSGPVNTNFDPNLNNSLDSISDFAQQQGITMPDSTSGVRPYDNGSLHQVGRAADYPRTDPEFNQFMYAIIGADSTVTAPYLADGNHDGIADDPVYYVTFPDGTTGRIIDEDNAWHIDNGQAGETFGRHTF